MEMKTKTYLHFSPWEMQVKKIPIFQGWKKKPIAHQRPDPTVLTHAVQDLDTGIVPEKPTWGLLSVKKEGMIQSVGSELLKCRSVRERS